MKARFEYLDGNKAVYSFRGPRSHRRVYMDVMYAPHDPVYHEAVAIEKILKVILESRNNPEV